MTSMNFYSKVLQALQKKPGLTAREVSDAWPNNFCRISRDRSVCSASGLRSVKVVGPGTGPVRLEPPPG